MIFAVSQTLEVLADLLDFERSVLVAVAEKLKEPPNKPVQSSQAVDQTELPRHLYEKNGLVVSFNPQGKPFFGDSRGYNQNRIERRYSDNRWYIRQNRLLDQIGRELVTKRGRGGRVFIDVRGVRTKPKLQYLDIVNWTLPRSSPLLRERLIETN